MSTIPMHWPTSWPPVTYCTNPRTPMTPGCSCSRRWTWLSLLTSARYSGRRGSSAMEMPRSSCSRAARPRRGSQGDGARHQGVRFQTRDGCRYCKDRERF